MPDSPSLIALRTAKQPRPSSATGHPLRAPTAPHSHLRLLVCTGPGRCDCHTLEQRLCSDHQLSPPPKMHFMRETPMEDA
jgi:hypothetical protein